MKILKKTVLILLIASITAFFIGGCSKDDSSGPNDQLIGTWELVKITANLSGISTDIEPSFLSLEVTLEVRNDGTYTLTQNHTDTGTIDVETGTWTATDKTVTINPDDGDPQQIDYTVDGDTATLDTVMSYGEYVDLPVKMIYTRQ